MALTPLGVSDIFMEFILIASKDHMVLLTVGKTREGGRE